MKKIILLTLVFLLSCTSFCWAEDANFEQGVNAFNDGKFPEAIKYFTATIATNANDADAYHLRGLAHYCNDDALETALSDLNKANELMPTNIQGFVDLADIYYDQQKFTEALTSYNAALKNNPDNKYGRSYIILAQRGNTKLMLKDYSGALADYDTAIAVFERDINDIKNPDYSELYFNRGIIHQRLGERDKAQADIDKAKSLYKQAQEAK